MDARGQLLDGYRNYLTLLAWLQLGRTLQGKADPADLVQETFLRAYRDFAQFRGTTEVELLGWLRQILATTAANFVRHYLGTRGRDTRLERQMADELDRSSCALDRGLVAPVRLASERKGPEAAKASPWRWPTPSNRCRRRTGRLSSCDISKSCRSRK